MTEIFESRNDFHFEASIPVGAVPLESILCTGELRRRPSRQPDYERENRALGELASALADSASTIFQTLADRIRDVTQCDSAGLSLLTNDDKTPHVDGKRFYWPAIAGIWGPHVGGGTPRNFGPCGDVLDQNRTLLFTHFERRYPYLIPVDPAAEECLLVPFYVDGKAVGTIWGIMHSDRRKFDAEDERVMVSLGKFASSAYRAVTYMRELDRRVAERTVELTSTNEQLREARSALEKAFDEIRGSEARLRRVIDAIPAVAWCNLPDGPNEFLSKSWHEYTGLSPEESHGWGWQAAFHSDDLPALLKRWQEMLVSREPGEIEARIRRHDGVYRWFLIRAEPFFEEGKLVRWYGTSTDIDDLKRAEQALRDSEQSSRLVLDGIAGLVAIMSTAGELKAVNRQVLEYFGKNIEDLNTWITTDAVHPEDLADVISAWTHSVETAVPYDVDHRLRGADGVYRWFHARGLPLRDEAGDVARWYILLTDIDDRRRAVEALQASEREFDWIVNTIPALAWAASPDGSAEFFNQHYLAYVGLPLERLQGSGWTGAVHPDDLGAVTAAWQTMMATGKGGEVEGRLRRSDGEYRWFLFRTNPMLGESGNILKWYGTNTDIDDRKRAESELRNTQTELGRVMRAMTMGQLTASIAHEVNQPLSGIITNASTCLRMLDANPPNVEGARETVRRTIRDGNRASEVITRLRTLYSKKDADLEPMDLNEATREVIALSLSELEKKRVVLRYDLAEGLPPVMGDRIQIQQVIQNLIRNGSDAMDAVDDRLRELKVKTDLDENGGVRLSVKDSGVGIEPDGESKLFEPFYTTKSDGMGIGLSVSRSIMDSHRGRLWAVPNEGPGATFFFSMPQGTDTKVQ